MLYSPVHLHTTIKAESLLCMCPPTPIRLSSTLYEHTHAYAEKVVAVFCDLTYSHCCTPHPCHTGSNRSATFPLNSTSLTCISRFFARISPLVLAFFLFLCIAPLLSPVFYPLFSLVAVLECDPLIFFLLFARSSLIDY